MTVTDYYRDIQPNLDRILRDAEAAKLSADHVLSDVVDLPARPHWTTKAEDSLERAEVALWHALKAVRSARHVYRHVLEEKV